MPPRFKLRDSGGRFQSEADWFKVKASGPIFDGTGARATADAVQIIEDKVATAAQRHVQTIGRRNFRYGSGPPTYFFENNVETDRVVDGAVVHADQVVYGPWLEGVSSRNQTTRFKGYQLFRKATTDVEKRLDDILAPEERDLLAALGGGSVRVGPRL